MLPKISIIMPSYNVVKYIDKCLNSVVRQTLKDIEIIIVDKYSTDGTREIIEKYKEKDKRIILLNDDVGSCGYSNNIAIENATGKYIGIVETDDYIDEEMYEFLYDLAEKNELDYIKSDFKDFITNASGQEITVKHKLLYDYMESNYNKCIYSNEFPELPLYDCCMWNGIYRREYLIKNHIRFNESPGAAFQDHGFLWQAIGNAGKVMYVDKAFYHYRKDNENSSMHNSYALQMDLKELKFIYKHIEKLTKRNSEYRWMFLKKVFSIMDERLQQFFYNGGNICDEIINCVVEYRKLLYFGNLNNDFKFNELKCEKIQEFLILNKSVKQYIEILNEKVKAIEIIQKDLFERVEVLSNAVIFGCGENGKHLYWHFIQRGIDTKVIAFFDNDKNRWGENFLGKIIMSPEQNVKKFSKSLFIIANDLYCYDLKRQLLRYGVERDKIFICRFGLGKM